MADARPATRLVHSGSLRSQFRETSEAIFLTQGFVYDTSEAAEARFRGEDDGFIYARYGSPTNDMFEKRMCALEGAEEGRATASGMAAITAAILCQLKAGDHVVAARAMFGSCRWVVEVLAPRYGIDCTIVDGRSLEAWETAVRSNTKVFLLESPTNPTLEIVDIAAVAKLANQVGAKVIVDNVLSTPMFQRPLELGAHIVVYSTTKHIDGQGRSLGGIILSDKEWMEEHLQDFYRHTGPAMSPFTAWMLLKGLETLPLRVAQQSSNAARIADFLAEQKQIARVIYPGRVDHPQAEIIARQMSGGSTVVAFEMNGGKEAAYALQNALRVVRISNNFGDAKSLVTHPATTTHKNLSDEARAELSINAGTIRFSAGLEDPIDLIEDFSQALAHSGIRSIDPSLSTPVSACDATIDR